MVTCAVGEEELGFVACAFARAYLNKDLPLARVTVEDCLEQEENRFALVVLASYRARALMKGTTPLVASKNKPVVTALREIAKGRVRFHRDTSEVLAEYIAELARKYA